MQRLAEITDRSLDETTVNLGAMRLQTAETEAAIPEHHG